MTVRPARESVVWKFTLPPPTITGRCFVDIPEDAQPLSVGMQNGNVVVWALVDPHRPEEMRRFIVANTGADIPGLPEAARFIGTLVADTGIVWHVWDGDA